MGRRVSFVSVLLIVGLVAGALPAPGQEAPATWGRLKRIYAGAASPVVAGTGVSPAAAQSACEAARARARLPFAGPVVVRGLARSEAGVVLAVHTRAAGGVEAAHLVAGDGRYLGGVELDPAGWLRDAATGERLGRFDPGELPGDLGTEGLLQDFVRRSTSIACNATATLVLEKCLAMVVPVSPFPGSLGCVAAAAAVLLACEALADMHYQLEDPEMGDPGLEYQPGDSAGDGTGG